MLFDVVWPVARAPCNIVTDIRSGVGCMARCEGVRGVCGRPFRLFVTWACLEAMGMASSSVLVWVMRGKTVEAEGTLLLGAICLGVLLT